MGETRRCIKCGRIMLPGKDFTPKRDDAKQCKNCRRKQQDESSYQIKKRKRKIKSLKSSKEKAIKTGADEQIEKEILCKLEDCLKDLKNPTEKEFEFLKKEMIYDFEKRSLPKKVQDNNLRKLRETKFKDIFNKINSLSST